MYYAHLQGVLTLAECQDRIMQGAAIGFETALVNKGDGTEELITRIRNNQRVIWDDVSLASSLTDKLQVAMGADFPYQHNDVTFLKAGSHFRMYRYLPEQYFKPHKDGSFQDVDSESEITALFYLNDTDGGETVLMPYGKEQDWAHIHIKPKSGDVLLFDHNTWHEGRPVHTGEKFVLRTDLFYK